MGLKVNALRGALALLRLSALGAVVLGTSASFAVPTTDGDNGVYSDAFTDAVGISSLNGAAVNLTGLVVLTGASPGVVETKDILPTALSGWRFLYLKGTGALSAEVFANNTWSALTLGASDDPAYTHRASLAAIGTAKPVRFRVTFASNGPLAPSLDSLKATWSPKTTLQLVATRPNETFCSGESRQWRFPFSVSSVSATDTLVWVELPSGVLNPDFGQDSKLRFISATEGGRINATGASIYIRGTEIRPNTVYWDLGTVRFGTSFPLVVTAQIPNGTLDGTSYTLTARAMASNGGQAIAATALPTLARSAPQLIVDKSLTGVYRIGGENRVQLGSTIGYRVTVTNAYAPTCRAVAQKLVLWDPFDVTTVSKGLNPYSAAPTLLTAGLVPNTAGQNVYTTGPAPMVSPLAIPANAPFALIDKLAPGESRTFEFQVSLADGSNYDGERVTNTAYVNSAYGPHAGVIQGSASFRFGIDYTPHGIYAKGESIRGSAAISAINNDNRFLNVGYGEYFEYLLYATNDGASVLEKTTLFDKLPTADVDFVNAWAPPGNTVYYNAGGATNLENAPPDYDPTTGTLGGTWSTTPTTPVTWVAVAVPRIGSSIITNHNGTAPTSVTAKIGVTVKSSEGCTEKTIRNPAYFHTASTSYKIGQTVTTTPWTNPGLVDAELTNVVVRVPSFATAWASATPTVKSGSGELDYSVTFTNSLPGAANLTDTAMNVIVRVDMPKTSIAGAIRPLDLVAVSTSNGTVDDSGLPDYFEVSYPPVGPGNQVVINIKTSAPRGVVDGGTARLLATIRYADVAPGACPVSTNAAQATATFSVDPKFQIDKRVDFAVAGRNKPLTHTLRMVNIGEGASLNTVVFDRLPDNIEFVDADAPAFGQVIYFSAADVPNLPLDVRAIGDWTRELVLTSGLFVPGVVANGLVTSPVANPKWIAVLVDDNTLTPPQLPATGAPREIVFRSLIPANAPLDTLIVNEAIINASGMAPAVSNLVQTLISDDPALEIAGICPSIVAAGENVPFTYTFTNNSTNDDETVITRIILPTGLAAASLKVTANGVPYVVTLPNDPDRNVTSTTDALGTTTLAWDVTAFLGDALEPGKTVSMDLEVEVGNVDNGETLPVYTSGTAINGAGTINVGSVCTLLVENPDLRVLKLVSQSEVVEGDTLQYTLVVNNLGRREVTNAIIRDSLPAGLTIVQNSISVSPSTWTIGVPYATGATDPDNDGAIYEWSLDRGNALDGPDSPAGTVPGLGGPIYIRFRANVTSATAGSTISNCANVALGPEADGDQLSDQTPGNDRACVDVTVPNPDPTIAKTGPLTVLSGSTYAYTLTYRNLTRQSASDVVVYERLPKVRDLTAPSVRFVNTVLPAGVAAWYSLAPYNADVTLHPTFNPTDTTGWTQDANAANATWVAFHIAELPGLATARDITVQVEATDPNTGNLLPAGAEIINCALITSPGVDNGPGNNQACVTTFIEGLNVAITKVCDPSGFLPGGRPGDEASFTITVENLGTDPAFGIVVTDLIPSWFTLAAVEPAFASAVDEGGTVGNFATPVPDVTRDNVPWTREGDTWYLGSRSGSDTSYYRMVGLFPGQSTQLIFRGTIDIEAAGGLLATNQASVFSARVQDSFPAERDDVLADNASSCAFTVQRPDPMVIKTALTTNANGSVGAGETINYIIEFDNLGLAPADNVILQDEILDGVDFIVGSLTDVPGNAVVEYYSDAYGWGHVSQQQVGQPDPEVLAFRIRFSDFPAPLSGSFEQDDVPTFESGTFSGTQWDAIEQAVVASPGASNPVYLSPVVPTNSATVIEWLGIFARGSGAGLPAPRIDLLDGDSSLVVLSDITLDEGGSRSLADLDPATTPLLQLRATFESRVTEGGEPYGDIQFLDAPVGIPQNGEVWKLYGDGLAAGVTTPSGGGGSGDGGGGGGGELVIWEREGDSWEVAALDGEPGGALVRIDYLDADLLIATFGNSSAESTLVYRRDATSWVAENLPTPADFGSGQLYVETVTPLTGSNPLCASSTPCLLAVAYSYDYNTNAQAYVGYVVTPTSIDAYTLPFPAGEFSCFQPEANTLGYVVAQCSNGLGIWSPTGTGWLEVPSPATGYSYYSSVDLAESDATIFVATSTSDTSANSVLRLYEDPANPPSWLFAPIAVGSPSDRVAYYDGGPDNTFFGARVTTENGAADRPVVWTPDGSGGYEQTYLPTTLAASTEISVGRVGPGGILTADGNGFERRIWRRATGLPPTYVEVTAGQASIDVFDVRFGDDGRFFTYADYPTSPLDAFVPAGPEPTTGYYTYEVEDSFVPYSSYRARFYDSGLDLFGGSMETVLSTDEPAVVYPTIWDSSVLRPGVGSYVNGVMTSTRLPTPTYASGRILAGTLDGCLIGEVKFPDGSVQTFTWQKVDGEYVASQLTDANGFTDLKFVVATPEHRIFGTASDGESQVVVELGCATGEWFVTQVPMDGFDTGNLFGYKNGLLYGNLGQSTDGGYDPTFGVNAFWQADASGNTRLLVREFDDVVPFDDDFSAVSEGYLFPRAEGGLVYGNGRDEYYSLNQALVWEPITSPSGVDDFTVTALPVPVGTVHSTAVDFDGVDRILGEVIPAVGPRQLVIWTRGPMGWEVSHTAEARAAIQFLGTGPDAKAIASDPDSGEHFVFDAQLLNPQPVAWNRLNSMDPNDELYAYEWVRRAFDAGYAPGQIFGVGQAILSQTPTGYLTTPLTAGMTIIGMPLPGVFVLNLNGEVHIGRFDAGGVLAIESTGVFGFDYLYPGNMGAADANGAFTLWNDADYAYIGGSNFYQVAFAFYPDASHASGYQNRKFFYFGQTAELEVLNGYSPGQYDSFYNPAPPGTPLGNGCWSFAEVALKDPNDNTYQNNVLGSGAEPSNLRLWGCPLVSGPPTEALSSWGVTYRTDTRPSVGFETLVEDVCQRTIDNTATISTSTPQLSTGNDSSTVTTPVETADLAIELITDASVISTTGDRTFTVNVRVSNRGPQLARTTTATIDLPAGLDVVAAPGFTVAGGKATYVVGDLGPNNAQTYPLTLQLTSTDADVTYPIAAGINSRTIDCTTDNDTFSLVMLSGQHPDIKVTKTGPATVRVGEPFTWVVAWENRGTVAVNNLSVTDTLPAGLTNVALGNGSTGSVAGSQVSWTGENLDLGATRTDTITATVTDCGLIDQPLTNSIAAPLALDANPNDNQAAHTTLVLGPRAAVDVTLVQSQALVALGDTVFYTAHFRSTGTATATGTAIRVQTPFVPVLNSISHGGTYANGFVTFNLPPLAPGAVGSVTFAAPVTTNETLTAEVRGGNICPSPSTTVSTSAATDAPQVLKTADVNNACTDDVVTWTILVTNPGTTPLNDVTVTDPVTGGMAYVPGTITGPNGSAIDPANLTWSIPTIAPGAHSVLTFKTVITASTGTLVSNSATWTANSGAMTADTNAASIRIACDNALKIKKSLSLSCESPPRLTVTLDYTNAGTTPLTGVSVSDTFGHLPATGISLPSGSFASQGLVIFYPGDLAPGQSGTTSYSFNLGFDADDDGTLVTDRATITANGVPPQTSNQAAVPVRVCDDSDACTTNICSETGCVFIAIEGCVNGCQSDLDCDDGLACTTNTCDVQTGECTSTTVTCNDGFACTADTCAEPTGDCRYDPIPSACSDLENECVTAVCDTSDPTADSFTGCVANTDATACTEEAGNTCVDTTCDVDLGCVYTNNDMNACTDGDLCTEGDSCVAGNCVSEPVDCGDGATCTVDTCVNGDCRNTPVVNACVDSECSTSTCAPTDIAADPTTGCVVTTDANLCNDNNPCTIDSCNALTGLCDNVIAVGLACDDDFACTTGDACDASGACSGGTPDDNFCDGLGGQNPCREGTCDPDAPAANLDGCVVSNTAYGIVVQANIPCGENACAIGTGNLVCDGEGGQVSTCDPAYEGVSDIGDDQCLEQELVVYALIDDPQTGALRGSVRCLRSAAGVVSCETEGTDADTGLPLLKIYDELLCPGTLPVVPTP